MHNKKPRETGETVFKTRIPNLRQRFADPIVLCLITARVWANLAKHLTPIHEIQSTRPHHLSRSRPPING